MWWKSEVSYKTTDPFNLSYLLQMTLIKGKGHVLMCLKRNGQRKMCIDSAIYSVPP